MESTIDIIQRKIFKGTEPINVDSKMFTTELKRPETLDYYEIYFEGVIALRVSHKGEKPLIEVYPGDWDVNEVKDYGL